MTRTVTRKDDHRGPAARAAGPRRLVRWAVVVPAIAMSAFALDALARQSKPPDAAHRPFVISGEVDGVVPTVGSSLLVRLDNPNRFDLSVRTLTIAVGDAGPGCAASNLVVGAAALPVTVPANGQATVPVSVGFVDDPADACQGAEFPLTYAAMASRARSTR